LKQRERFWGERHDVRATEELSADGIEPELAEVEGIL
jgi:hypothetical protein